MDHFLNVSLDPSHRDHLYVQLYKALKKMITSSDLLPNEKLPPIRTYADALGVNAVTIVNAYKLLEQHGLVYKKVGSGTYVRSEVPKPIEKLDQRYHDPLPNQEVAHIGINLSTTTPSDYLFPVDDFKKALNEVLDRDKGGAFGYQDSRGYLPLRQAIASHILKASGIESVDTQIQILSGAQQGLDVVSKALLNYGDTVIVEAPTYTGAIATFKSRGAKILELPLEADGPNMMKLREYIYQHRPKLLYIMPTLQNPTGLVYSEEKKRALLDLCEKHQLMVLEDDYCSEFTYDQTYIQPLKALDTIDQVIYLKSFSKTVMPGLRLGFMITPDKLKNQVILAKQTTDITTSGLSQRAVERFITSGAYDKQRALMYTTMKNRYSHAVEAVKSHLGDRVEAFSFKGGVALWLKLTNNLSSKHLYQELKKRGILIAAGDAFYASKTDSPYFRITISDVEADELNFAIRMIAKVIDELDQAQGDHFKPIL